MADMKKVDESWFPPGVTMTIIVIFALCSGLLFLLLVSPLIVLVLITRDVRPSQVRELYREIRGHW